MVNCPQCGTPNPDQSSKCLACEASLAGQKFAQELDRVQKSRSSATYPAVQPAASSPTSTSTPDSTDSSTSGSPYGGARDNDIEDDELATSAFTDVTVDWSGTRDRKVAEALADAEPQTLEAAAAPPAALPKDPGLAAGSLATEQDAVTQFMAAARARAKRARIGYAVLISLVAIAAAAYFYRSKQQEERRTNAARFLKAFTDLDNGASAAFWRCTVRAKHADIHRASDNLVVTKALEGAFKADPRGQPGRLEALCLPMLSTAVSELEQLAPPTEFVEPLAELGKAFEQVGSALTHYIGRLEQAKERGSAEASIAEAGEAFHAIGQRDRRKAAGYVSLLRCAVPNLIKIAKRVRVAPDTQRVVEYIYTSCKRDPAYADKLRRECIPALDRPRRDRAYRLILGRMSGDSRDLSAIEHCFKKANEGFFAAELGAVGQSWVAYRNAVKAVLNRVRLYKRGGE